MWIFKAPWRFSTWPTDVIRDPGEARHPKTSPKRHCKVASGMWTCSVCFINLNGMDVGMENNVECSILIKILILMNWSGLEIFFVDVSGW